MQPGKQSGTQNEGQPALRQSGRLDIAIDKEASGIIAMTSSWIWQKQS
jgi:hypothetical protein